MGINQKDAWETASGAAKGEAFSVIPGSLDASKNGLKVLTVLAGRACVQLFRRQDQDLLSSQKFLFAKPLP